MAAMSQAQHEIATAWKALQERKATEQAEAAKEQQAKQALVSARKAHALADHIAGHKPFSRRERRGPGRH